jgi:hypothetical protein
VRGHAAAATTHTPAPSCPSCPPLQLLPQLWTTALLTLLLLLLAANLLAKGLAAYAAETREALAWRAAAQRDELLEPLLLAGGEEEERQEGEGAAGEPWAGAGAAAGGAGKRDAGPAGAVVDQLQGAAAEAKASPPGLAPPGQQHGAPLQLQDAASSGDQQGPPRGQGSPTPGPRGGTASAALEGVHRSDHRRLPPLHLGLLLFLSSWVVAVDTLKLGQQCGSWQYWALVGSVALPALATLLAMRARLLRHAALKQGAGPLAAAGGGRRRLRAALPPPSPPPPLGTRAPRCPALASAEFPSSVPASSTTDLASSHSADAVPPGAPPNPHLTHTCPRLPPADSLHWTRRSTLLYPLYCSTAGVMAGMFGVGGGIVKG